MEAEDLAFDDSCQWQVIEEFSECLPHIRISILSQTLVVETVPAFRDDDKRVRTYT